jgi:hypothetical protein
MQADEFNADARHEIDDGDHNLTFDICHSAKSERQMANGKWQMANGKRQTANGKGGGKGTGEVGQR